MKLKKIMAIGLICTMTASAFAGCGGAKKEETAKTEDGKVVKDGPTDETIKKEELENIYEIKFDIQNIDNRKICVYF